MRDVDCSFYPGKRASARDRARARAVSCRALRDGASSGTKLTPLFARSLSLLCPSSSSLFLAGFLSSMLEVILVD